MSISETIRVSIKFGGVDYKFPWIVDKFTEKISADGSFVGGTKKDIYKTKEEALEEALRYLKANKKGDNIQEKENG